MKLFARINLGLAILAILALAACTPGQLPLPPLQPTAVVEQPAPTVPPLTEAPTEPATQPTVQPAGTLQPPSEEVCSGMAQALSEALSRATGQATPMEITLSQVSMTDYARGGAGTGCRAMTTGTGEQFSGPDAVIKAITEVLTGGGWQEDINLQAGGPTGASTGYRSGDLVSIASAGWQPDAATSCPSDKPISECQVPPEHQAYTITLDTAQTLGYGGAMMPNPASQNCEAQGGSLTIEERGDGGQYGVCYFADNQQCEEWALMRGECPVGGVKVSGYATPAGRYCAITGGTYEVTGKSGASDEQGVCTLPGGTQCDAWDYYNGKCDATSGAAPEPATQGGLSLIPPSEEVCNGMAQALAQALSMAAPPPAPVEVTQAAEPVEMAVPSGLASAPSTGTGCGAAATGTGEQFSSPSAVMDQIRGVLTAGGWTEDMQLVADGPTGTAAGFRSGELVSIASAMWRPDASVNCPTDQPISTCQLTPAQQLYTITIDTAQEVGKGSAAMPNPASQNCEAQGGSLTIQEGPGGQYGVCYFEDNKQCEEWALMRGNCPAGGVKVMGYTTMAATYCAITGGAYAATGKTGQVDERGTCTLPDGKQCEVWSYYLGGCESPVIGAANPASKNCVAQGGRSETQERADGGQYRVCYFDDNRQCEEWALLRGQCPAGGVKVTGYATDAATYCAITGGAYTITGKSGQPNEQGICALPDGTQCEVWSFYQGGCEPARPAGAAPNMPNPAAENCVAEGGTLTIEERGDGGQFGVCTFTDNLQCEEWALMRGQCPAGGVKVAGYTTPAARYCAITGGQYAATGTTDSGQEAGDCTLPGGKV